MMGAVRCPHLTADDEVSGEGTRHHLMNKVCHSCESRNPEGVTLNVQREYDSRMETLRPLDSRMRGNDTNPGFP